MPHKHKRRAKDDKDYELPPTATARPLSTSKPSIGKPGKRDSAASSSADAVASKKRKRTKAADDDTPKAFARLMAFQRGVKPRSGLDDGQRQGAGRNKKRKVRLTTTTKTTTITTTTDGAAATAGATAALDINSPQEREQPAADLPRILPGERMADFSARVDAALPLSVDLVSNRRVAIEGVKRNRTRLERKITRMQDEWRERDKRLKDRLEEAREDEEIEAILNGDDDRHKVARVMGQDDENNGGGSKARNGKKGKKKKRKGGADDSDDDPWASVAKARKEAEEGRKGLVGIHDVVQAPPKFDVKPREKFKIRDGAKVEISNVPRAAGSLKRREELNAARADVLASYRSR